jgi:hypothetical protein
MHLIFSIKEHLYVRGKAEPSAASREGNELNVHVWSPIQLFFIWQLLGIRSTSTSQIIEHGNQGKLVLDFWLHIMHVVSLSKQGDVRVTISTPYLAASRMPFAGEQVQLITYCTPQLGRANLNSRLRPSLPSHVSSCRSYKNTAEPRRLDVGETDDSSLED